jgi:glycosyltransferase involved in cell wall biosynthesis
MRVLMLSQFYPPIIGGGAIHARSLGIELVSRGHDVAVVTLWHQGQAEFELDRGVRVYRVRSSMRRAPWLFGDEGRQYAPPFPDPEVMLALRRIILHEQPEIVHAHNWLVYSFLPLKAWSGARLIVTLHSYDLVCAKTTLLYQGSSCDGPGFTKCLGCAAESYGLAKGIPTVLSHWVMDLIRRGAVDMFLPVSQPAAVGNGLVGSRLPFQVIPNFLPSEAGVPEGDIEPYLAQLPSEDYLLFAGALSRQKGVDVLLRAYAGLPKAPPLVLIGYPTPEWSILSVDCPDNVFVLKAWPRYAIMEAWRRSMLALAPSVVPETFGMVVMEAMSTGCPVIASRIGGLVDLVADGETGFLVQPGDSLALQQAIERLLADPDLRRRMGQAALRKVVEFQASTVVPRIEQVYEELLQKVNLSQRTGLRDDSVGASEA